MRKSLPLLIVEGNESMIKLLERFFALQCVCTQAVSSVTDAEILLTQRFIHVMLTDLFHPQGSGLALLKRSRQVTPQTQVILMGSFLSPQVQREAVECGAFAFIEKPFRLEQLWTLVRQALHESGCLTHLCQS